MCWNSARSFCRHFMSLFFAWEYWTIVKMQWPVTACVFKHSVVVECRRQYNPSDGFWNYGSSFCDEEYFSDIAFEKLEDKLDLLHTFENSHTRWDKGVGARCETYEGNGDQFIKQIRRAIWDISLTMVRGAAKPIQLRWTSRTFLSHLLRYLADITWYLI